MNLNPNIKEDSAEIEGDIFQQEAVIIALKFRNLCEAIANLSN